MPHLKVVAKPASQILKLVLNVPRAGVVQDAYKLILECKHRLGLLQNLLVSRSPLVASVNPKVVIEVVNL